MHIPSWSRVLTPYRKTQLVAEYAHRYRNTFSSVFWIRAARPATLRSSYANIAKCAGLVTKIDGDQDEDNAIKEAKRWLECNDSGNWLLIFDNGDDAIDGPGTLDSHGRSLIKQIHLIMPIRGNSILTTRDKRSVGTSIARYPFEVTTMPETEALELFLNRAMGPDHFETPSETQAALELVKMLGLLPLAIDQAAGYIRTLQMPIQEYIRKMEEPAGLLSSADMNDHELLNHPTSVMRTWEVSLEYVDKNIPLAGKLLRLMGFLDNECIFEDVLDVGFYASNTGVAPPPLLESLLGDDPSHEYYIKALESLHDLSLIRRGKHKGDATIWMHRLVHLWLKERMPVAEKPVWLVGAVELLGHSANASFFPTSNSEYTYQLFLKNLNLFTGEDSVITHRTITVLLAAEKLVPFDLGSIHDLLKKIDFFISKADNKHRIAGLAALVILKIYSIDMLYARCYERHLDFWATVIPVLEKAAYAIEWVPLGGNTGISSEFFKDFTDIFLDTDHQDLSGRIWWHYVNVIRKPASYICKDYSYLSASFYTAYGNTLVNLDEHRKAAYCFHSAILIYLDAGREPTYDLIIDCLDNLLDCLEELDDYIRFERVLVNDFLLTRMDPNDFTEGGLINKYMSRLEGVMKKSNREPQFAVLLARFCGNPTRYPEAGMEHHLAGKRRRRRIQLFSLLAQQQRYDFAVRLLANNIEKCDWSGCDNCVVFQMDPWRELIYTLCTCLEESGLGDKDEILACRNELKSRLDGRSKRVNRISLGTDGYLYHDEATDEDYRFKWEGDEGSQLRGEILGKLGTSLAALRAEKSRRKLRVEIQELGNTLFRKVDEPWEMDVPLARDAVFWSQIERQLWEENMPDIPTVDVAAIEKELVDISKQLTEDLDKEEFLRQNTR
jgi:hypothetical protein